MNDVTKIVDEFLKWKQVNENRRSVYFDFDLEEYETNKRLFFAYTRFYESIQKVESENNFYKIRFPYFFGRSVPYLKRYDTLFYFNSSLYLTNEIEYAGCLLEM